MRVHRAGWSHIKIRHSAAVGAGQKAYSGSVPFSGDTLGFVKGAPAGGDIFGNINVDDGIVRPLVALLGSSVFLACVAVHGIIANRGINALNRERGCLPDPVAQEVRKEILGQ